MRIPIHKGNHQEYVTALACSEYEILALKEHVNLL
jgi:hypothetical protein